MSRMRSIKPDFFTDEDVGKLTPIERLAFIGLWTEADRCGRLVERIRTLKVKILPFDDVDLEAILDRLATLGFIVRYEILDVRYIEIRSFKKHQKPHPKEADLGFPGAPKASESTISREVSRPAVESPDEPQPIPSSPRSSGSGSGGGYGGGEWERAAPPVQVFAQGPVEPEPIGALQDGLMAVYLEEKGQPYEWGSEDDLATRAVSAPVPEVLRRWRIALRRERYPVCATVSELKRHWKHYATDSPGAPNVRKGTVRAEDEDWSNEQTGTGGFR